MQQFVLIFRQGSGAKPSREEQSKRSAEIRAWAKKWTEEGYTFDPRALSQEAYEIAPEGESDGATGRQVINLLFLTAKDFEDAVRIAKSHPGTRFGTFIEVRAWTPPVLPAADAH
jgi:hypothetical protein